MCAKTSQRLVTALALVTAVLPSSLAQVTFHHPMPANSNAASDQSTASGDDYVPNDYDEDTHPALAADGAGNLVLVWDYANASHPNDPDYAQIRVCRRQGRAAGWTDPAVVANYDGYQPSPDVALDGAGNVLCVFATRADGWPDDDYDIVCCRSRDGGVQWEAPVPLDPQAGADTRQDQNPRVATDGVGRWLVVWRGVEYGEDYDIYMSRSLDGGATWSGPVALNEAAATDDADDECPVIVSVGDGHWIAAWCADTLRISHSYDNGDTWTAPAGLGATQPVGTFPHLGTDGRDGWMAAWEAGDVVMTAFSADDGVTWAAPVPGAPSGYSARVASDGGGRWGLVCVTRGAPGDTIGADQDLLWASSSDNGRTWSEPVPANANADEDAGGDILPTLVAGTTGEWTVVWQSQSDLPPGLGWDYDLLYATAPWDTDGDGLPDAWENMYGLSATDPDGNNGAEGDPDGDGNPNWLEYELGTDPTALMPPVPSVPASGLVALAILMLLMAAVGLRRVMPACTN